MCQHCGSDAFALDVFTDCLSQQTGDILMLLFGKRFEVIPDSFVNF